MLHFFSLDELSRSLRVADRFVSDLRGVRDQTTVKLNNFMRRRLDAETDLMEIVGVPSVSYGDTYNIYLKKKNISNIAIGYSRSRFWDENPWTVGANFDIEAETGRISVYGPVYQAKMGLRITYDGGYPALANDDEVMDCPKVMEYAAMKQAVFDGRRALGVMGEGTGTDDHKSVPIKMRAGTGLLLEVADIFQQYRRTLGH